MVKGFKAFFYSETSKKEFETEFKKKLSGKILENLNSMLQQGVKLPLGISGSKSYNSEISVFEEYLLITADGK